MQASHAALFRECTHQTYELERSGHSAKAFQLLRPSEQNVEQALDWQLAQGDTEAYLQWCAQACMLQLTHGRIRRAIARLRQGVQLPVRSDAELSHSAKCCFTLSRALLSVNDLAGSVQAVRQARQRARGSDDELLIEKIGTQLCVVRVVQMSLRAATMHIEEVIRRRQSAYAPWGSPSLLSVYGGVLLQRGEFRKALPAAESALDAALSRNNRTDILLAHQQLLSVSLRHGLLDRARVHANECKAIENFGSNGVSHLYRQFLYFFLHLESEEYELARACLSTVRGLVTATQLPWDREITLGAELVAAEAGCGVPLPTTPSMQGLNQGDFVYLYAQVHCLRVRVLAQQGDTIESQASLKAALTLIRRSRNQLWASWLATSVAGMAADRAEHDVARRFLVQAEQLQRSAGIVPSPRQLTSWRRVRELAGFALELETLTPPSDQPLLATVDALEGWARSELAAPAATRARSAKRGPKRTAGKTHFTLEA